jgi:hypothetical protein
MSTKAEAVNSQSTVQRYRIQYPLSAYTFPHESLIHEVQIDESYVRIELTDRRILSIPLHWIPTVHNAAPEDRAKFRVNSSRTMIVWDPEEGSINEELRVQDYLETRPASPR